MNLLAIDPGSTQSAFVLLDVDTLAPVEFAKVDNEVLLERLAGLHPDVAVIEMVASYGMPVGAEVFGTCVWIGRFAQALRAEGVATHLVPRQPVKLHHCHSAKAKDSNVIQALVDRFAAGQPNRGKGTKANPGFFHGFSADVWQAFALAVYAAEALDLNLGSAAADRCAS